jgi:phosphoadenosine phosphosulfate reductase
MKILALSGGKDSIACLHLMREELDCAIYVDTGFAYPETHRMIDYAETIIQVHRVKVDRERNNILNGIPSDIVPIEWTSFGQSVSSKKPFAIQTSFQCCFDNIAVPVTKKAKELGATHIISGQRNDEAYKSTSRSGDVIDGLTRIYPIETWTSKQVMEYLSERMEIPSHFYIEHSSLDCYDCTAYRKHSLDRLAWTKDKYPEYYAAYALKYNSILDAMQEAIC